MIQLYQSSINLRGRQLIRKQESTSPQKEEVCSSTDRASLYDSLKTGLAFKASALNSTNFQLYKAKIANDIARGKYKSINLTNGVLTRLNPENYRSLERLLNEKDSSTNKNIFNGPEILSILENINTKYEATALDNILDISSRKHSAKNICLYIQNSRPENLKILKLLLAAKNKSDLEPRFCDPFIITEILGRIDNSQLRTFIKVLTAKNPANKNLRYSEKQIAELTQLFQFNLPIKKLLTETSVNSLSVSERISTLNFFRNASSRGVIDINIPVNLIDDLNRAKIDLPLLPTTDNKINEFLGQLICSLYRTETHSLDQQTIDKAFVALHNLPDSLNNFNFDTYANTGLPVKFSSKEFTRKIFDIINTLKFDKDKQLALDYFGITINKRRLIDLPIFSDSIAKRNKAINEAIDKEDVNKVLNALQKVLKRFIIENSVDIPGQPRLSKDLTAIIQAFPEFLAAIGKKQQETHKYSLDIHMLKAFKEFHDFHLINNFEFEDKEISNLFVLFHDIAKDVTRDDKHHPENSALIVHKMLKRVKLSDRDIERVCNLVRNHHWVENLEKELQTTADIAFDFRRPSDLKIAVLFAISDLKAVGLNFERKHINKYKKYIKDLKLKLKQVQNNAIYIPQTHIPEASKMPPYCKKMYGDKGKRTINSVIDLTKPVNLEKLGFDKGTTVSNFYAIIHAIPKNNKHSQIDFGYGSWEGNNGVFSASLVKADNFKTYKNRPVGFILDVDPCNIAAAYNQNIPVTKKYDTKAYKEFLFTTSSKDNKHFYRIHLPDIMKDLISSNPEINLKKYRKIDDTYKKIVQFLSNRPAITDIEDPQLKKLVKDSIDQAILVNNNDAGNKSELIVYAPKVKALFISVEPDEVEYNLRKYAQDNDIPLIKIKPTQ